MHSTTYFNRLVHTFFLPLLNLTSHNLARVAAASGGAELPPGPNAFHDPKDRSQAEDFFPPAASARA
jgi:hypothetical protein